MREASQSVHQNELGGTTRAERVLLAEAPTSERKRLCRDAKQEGHARVG